MQIQKIKISNFKSIYDPLELNFNEMGGFWKISGEVGAGKTTIGEAIIFGLFGSVNKKNNADLISWGERHGLIELWCRSKGRSLYIRREINLHGQSPTYVEVDGEEIVFTNKRDVQQQLENEYYDTTRTMVELLCIISFNNFKSIATMNTKDTKLFLDNILGFQVLTKYADVCKEFKNNNSLIINKIQADIRNINSQIDKIMEITNRDIIEGNIGEVQGLIDEIESKISEHTKIINEKISKTNSLISEKNGELGSIITLGKNKAREIEHIKSGICPLCGAKIEQDRIDIKLQEKEVLTKAYKDKFNEINDLKKSLEKLNSEHNKFIESYRSDLVSKRNLLSQLKEQEKRINIGESEIQNLKNRYEELNLDLDKYNIEDQEWLALFNILSIDIRQQILNSFIPSLNKNILEFTHQLQQPYIIFFDNDFKCKIKMSCMDDRCIPMSSLSTGQLKTVDMIIILGVLKSILKSSNINIMFLDELFSNLDVDLRNKMCAILKSQSNVDSTLFIISHQDIDDSYFDGKINIKLENFGNFQKKSNIEINYLSKNDF